jgi:hypothetical protein
MNEWLTSHELAEHAGIPYPHLWTYQKRGILPTADIRIGNKPLWSKSLIEKWDLEREAKAKLEQKP